MPAFERPGDLPPPILVEDAAVFGRLLDVLARCDEVAFDTEADSFFNYREKVCLVQVTADGADYLVDPLAGFDLTPLGEVLADPRTTKVFHDGEYDVLILKRDFGFEFRGMFDTRVAAAALGVANPGLASVLGDLFEVELDKSQQRSDWSRRPLTPKQIAYARLDTHYLVPLMHHLRPRLEERGVAMVVEGECRRVETLEPAERAFDPDEFVRIKGARTLDPDQMQALRSLFVLRDERARERDQPPFKVLSNAHLIQLARARPRTARDVARLRDFPPRLARQMGDAIAGAVREAAEQGPLARVPRLASRDGTGRLDDAQLELHERIKAWRKERAIADDFDASLVLNRHALLALVHERPESLEELRAVAGVQDWQAERYGEAIVALVRDFERDVAAGKIPTNARRRGRPRRRGGA